MNRCLRPCQQAVSMDEYRGETARVEQFLRTGGASLVGVPPQPRATAPAPRCNLRKPSVCISASRASARCRRSPAIWPGHWTVSPALPWLRSTEPETIELWFLARGRWQEPRRVSLSETSGAGQSLDRRMRELVTASNPRVSPTWNIFLYWFAGKGRAGAMANGSVSNRLKNSPTESW